MKLNRAAPIRNLGTTKPSHGTVDLHALLKTRPVTQALEKPARASIEESLEKALTDRFPLQCDDTVNMIATIIRAIHRRGPEGR